MVPSFQAAETGGFARNAFRGIGIVLRPWRDRRRVISEALHAAGLEKVTIGY